MGTRHQRSASSLTGRPGRRVLAAVTVSAPGSDIWKVAVILSLITKR